MKFDNPAAKNLSKFLFIFALLITGLSFSILKNYDAPAVSQNAPITPVPGEVKGDEISSPTLSIEKKIFGHSAQGKPIEGYVMGWGENVLFLHASIHGDEIGTTDLLNHLVEEIKVKPELVATSTKVIIIPIANPDGYYDRTDKLNANGVNLNLNFQTHDWQEYGPEGTYAGSQPFSEPESQVMKQVIEEYKPVLMLAFHSEGAVISPEDGQASEALGKWYSEKTGYQEYLEWDYPGTATKWFVETTGKPAITVEIAKQLKSDWDINKDALLELISMPILPVY